MLQVLLLLHQLTRTDEFYKLDKTIFEDYVKVGKKADSISTLLKFLKR